MKKKKTLHIAPKTFSDSPFLRTYVEFNMKQNKTKKKSENGNWPSIGLTCSVIITTDKFSRWR